MIDVSIEITDEISDKIVIASLIACKRGKESWEDCDGLEEAIDMVLDFFGHDPVLDRPAPEEQK